MKKFKKLMALAAVSMLGIQMMGVGTAFAADVDGECDLNDDSLEIALGYNSKAKANGDEDVSIYVDEEGMLTCEDNSGDSPYTAPADSISSLTVEMDDDDSNGSLYIYLDDSEKAAAQWPEFDTFDIDVTTTLIIDGTSVADAAGNSLDIVVGKSTFSFSGTSGSYSASRLEIFGGDDKDEIDASKVSVRVTADGNGEDDVIKGGSGNDTLTDDSCDDGDVIYGNAGNDVVEACGALGQAWGGEGHDDLSAGTVAPGAGNDDVDADTAVTYADLTGGVEVVDLETGGAAGDDDFGASTFDRLYGSAGDDVLVFDGIRVVGNAGDDVIKCNGCEDDGVYGADPAEYAAGGAGNDLIAEYGSGDNDVFYGNAGNDVLRGKGGDDTLRGGPGSDQAWGATGSKDLCTAEVMNRCELIKN